MIRGLSFILPNNYNEHSYLFEIISMFPPNTVWIVQGFRLYDWHNTTISDTRIYKNDDFLSAISELVDQNTLECCELFGVPFYPNDNETSAVAISNYTDFLSSDLTTAILIYDSAYCEIYLKNIEMCTIIKDAALRIGCEDIELITDENDARTVFYV